MGGRLASRSRLCNVRQRVRLYDNNDIVPLGGITLTRRASVTCRDVHRKRTWCPILAHGPLASAGITVAWTSERLSGRWRTTPSSWPKSRSSTAGWPARTADARRLPTRSAASPPPPVHAADGATTGLPLEPGARRPLLDLFPPPAARLPDSAARGTAAAARQIPPRDSRGEPRESTPRPRRDETFYGFVEPAFSLAPDPRFYFHSTEQDRAARELVDAIGRREQLLVVVGAPGIGKTMLCYAVAQQLDRRTLAAVVAAPPPTVDALVQALLVEFGLASRDASESSATARLGTLREFLSSLAARGASVLVAIDNAHTAAPDMLRALVALSNEAPRTLQI